MESFHDPQRLLRCFKIKMKPDDPGVLLQLLNGFRKPSSRPAVDCEVIFHRIFLRLRNSEPDPVN